MTTITKEISLRETLSRFIYSKSHYARTKGIVKYNAFMPDPYDNLSVFRTSDWVEDRIWERGKKDQDRTLKARGDVLASAVLEVEELFLDPDDDPPGHANIKGWPVGQENKSKRMEIAKTLADKARLFLCP